MIIATVIKSRIKCHLNELIRPGQNAFTKGRHIEDYIRLLFHVVDLTAANKIPGSTFTADNFKAFDLLKWDIMFRVVLNYCFGSVIVQWLKTFYTMPFSKIARSYFLSEKFSIAKGN